MMIDDFTKKKINSANEHLNTKNWNDAKQPICKTNKMTTGNSCYKKLIINILLFCMRLIRREFPISQKSLTYTNKSNQKQVETKK